MLEGVFFSLLEVFKSHRNMAVFTSSRPVVIVDLVSPILVQRTRSEFKLLFQRESLSPFGRFAHLLQGATCYMAHTFLFAEEFL
jgi:hypothetical protein